jgi:cell division septum initiation protein DivIVA
MTDGTSYFEVAGFLADIEDEYAGISDPISRTQQLVERIRAKWPKLTTSQAVAYIQVFRSS